MGVDLKIISDHLGHCDINVTADIYADVLSSTRKVLADSIEKKLTEYKYELQQHKKIALQNTERF